MVSAIRRIYNPLCKEKGLELMIECAIEPEIRLHSDQIRLNQILFNLLSNAVKFTHQGSICIKLALIQQGGIDKLMITHRKIRGSGLRRRIYSVFLTLLYKQNRPRLREYGGSGLGLSIVSSLVELLHGEITVKSEVGYGTRFDLLFPIRIVVNEELSGTLNRLIRIAINYLLSLYAHY
ncbi:sensor histidine kinase [Vibrio metschnikovii]